MNDALAAQVLSILEEFSTPARIELEPVIGPTFIRYALEPDRHTRAQSIIDLAFELQVRLKLDAPPIIHMDAGQLVIDLQRKDRQTVRFEDVRNQLTYNPPYGNMLVAASLNGSEQHSRA